MAVERGKDWGELGALPGNGIVAPTDLAVGAAIKRSHNGAPLGSLAAHEIAPVGLIGGDLRRTLGGRRSRGELRTPDAARATVDYGLVVVRDQQLVFVAHVVCRKAGWRGQTVAVMNAAFVGHWNVAPRAHPGDGKLDVVEANLSFSDRLKARRRLASGTHVPHPQIAEYRSTGKLVEFESELGVWVDGAYAGKASALTVSIVADGVRVVV